MVYSIHLLPAPAIPFMNSKHTFLPSILFFIGQIILILSNAGHFVVPVEEFERPYIVLQQL